MSVGDGLDLDKIAARADAATEGPWHSAGADEEDGLTFSEVLGGGSPGSMSEHQILICQHFLNKRSEADVEFIAAAREDVPALVAALRVARHRLDEVAKLHPRRNIPKRLSYGKGGNDDMCSACRELWPCSSAAALSSVPDPQEPA